jgi:hypothetical protein
VNGSNLIRRRERKKTLKDAEREHKRHKRELKNTLKSI